MRHTLIAVDQRTRRAFTTSWRRVTKSREGMSYLVAALALFAVACAPAAPGAPTAPAKPTEVPAAKPAEKTAPAAPAATNPPAAKPAAAPAKAVKRGGILKVGLESPIVDLDPHTMTFGWEIFGAAEHVYSGLVRADENLAPVPDLAERWDKSSDGKTYTFDLRQGVKFHNGRELEAADVKYSFERLLDPKTAAPYASFLESVQSIQAPEKYRVVVTLKEPSSGLLANLTVPAMAVVPREEVEQRGNLKGHMVGTGPFKFREHVPNSQLVLVRNPDYFVKDLPVVDEIDLLILPDPTARTSALRSGAVDLVDNVPAKDVKALRADPSLSVVGGPNLNYVSISLNAERKPLDNVKVRQALAYGVDRQEVINKAFDGLARPLPGTALIPPYWAGSSKQMYTTDYSKAKQLLAEAGYPNGFNMELLVQRGSFYSGPIMEVVQAEWRKIGVTSEIVVKDGAASFKDWKDGNFYTYAIRWWGADFVDPDGGLRPMFGCGGSWNLSRYCNSSLDTVLKNAAVEDDQQKRKQAYEQAMTTIAEDAPYIHLLSLDRYQAMRSHVKDYRPMVTASNQSFREVWLDK